MVGVIPIILVESKFYTVVLMYDYKINSNNNKNNNGIMLLICRYSYVQLVKQIVIVLKTTLSWDAARANTLCAVEINFIVVHKTSFVVTHMTDVFKL